MNIKETGFTLVELLITLAIFVILVTVGVPSFKNTYEQIRADNGIREIQQALSYARNQAISYGATVTMCANNNGSCGTDWGDGYLIYVSDNGGTMLQGESGEDAMLKVHSGFDSKDFVSFSGGNLVRFNSAGLASASGTFTYSPGSSSSAYSTTSVLSSSGKSQITESSSS